MKKPFVRWGLFTAALLSLALVAKNALAERQWIAEGPKPARYEISVAPDADAARFAGQAHITINAETAAPSVTLNALGLDFTSVKVDGANATFTVDSDKQTVTVTPRRGLRAGSHTLDFVYSGKIQDEAYGMFRAKYTAQDGQEKWMVVTQFEPGDARRMAPMWDQPDRRAVFALSVIGDSNLMAVSNMPAAHSERLADGKTRTTFADTPSMASYLLFFTLGDYERVTRDVDGVELGVVVRRGETGRTSAALDAGAQSLRFYNSYFGIKYPLPKLDMVGVPGAGGFGAMENWGAILYFDQYLLLDADKSSEAERQDIFGIVAHEIAHQWFGDYVTMAWWDDLWLNEGFASWMAAKAIQSVHPDWDPWLGQLTEGTATAMALDARTGTHPVVQHVDTIDEANLAFDSITYQKGLAVLRMIEAYVGEDAFRTGVRNYLNEHAYGNARTEDLWRSVQAASGAPVLDIARAFTGQVGYPVLETQGADCAAHPEDTRITMTQHRFALDAASRTGELWTIPVVAQRVGAPEVREVLPPQHQLSMDVGPHCGAYLINAGQTGFFRVRYDAANLARLKASMANIDPNDQLGLMLDYWAFARAGDIGFSDYLDLQAALPADVNPILALDNARSLDALADYEKERPQQAEVRAYARQRLNAFFARLGWTPRDGEAPNDALLRAELIETLGTLGDDGVVAEARRRIAASDTDPSALPASVRNAAFSVLGANATPAEYEALLARAKAASDFVEARRLWLRLAKTEDDTLAQRTLDLILGEDIPRQIRPQVLATVAGQHPRMAWDFLVAHRAQVETLLDPLQRLEYPGNIASASSDPAVADQLEAYAHDFPPGAMPGVASAAATIRLRAETIRERMPEVETWIAAHRERAQQQQRRRRPST